MALSALRTRSYHLLLGAPIAVLFAFIMVCVSDLSIAWPILILGGLGLVVITFLSKQPQAIFFSFYIATVSVELTKGLVAEGGVYTPSLYLSLSDLFLIPLVFTIVMERWLGQRPRQRWHPLLTAALIWLLWQWLRTLTSSVGVAALMSALNQTKYFIALWTVSSYLQNTEHWRQFMRAVGIAIALHFLMSILQSGTGGALQFQGIKASTQSTLNYADAGMGSLFRPSGLLSHPNALADFLVLSLPTMIGFLLLGKKNIGRGYISMTVTAALALLMLVLTLSRGGWGAFALGMLCFVFIGYRRDLVSARHIKRLTMGVVVSLMIVVIAFPTVLLRLTKEDNRSTDSRVLLAEQALLIIKRNPILGVGLGAYTHASARDLPPSYSRVSAAFRESLVKGVVHNKYLLVAAETGLIGLLLFLNVYRVALFSLWRARFDDDPQRLTLALGLLCGILAGLATFMLEHALIGVPLETSAILLGASVALTRQQVAGTARQSGGIPNLRQEYAG
ncbi:MAG: O-antigen ligase family protein [Gammaproteobacteria bacterium]